MNKSIEPNNVKKAIQLGCLNRPWNKFSLEDTLDGIKNAGFKNIGILRRIQNLKFEPETIENDYQFANKILNDLNLKLIMYSPNMNFNNSPKEITESQIPIMKILQKMDCHFILEMGTENKELYSKYYETMKYYSDAAQKYNIQVVLKPHGGISSSGALCAEVVQKVNSKNFRVCYDPANIFYYDGYDPIKELNNIAEYVTALIAKDYRPKPSEKPDVFVTPGDGEINFKEIFKILKKNNFSGPCLIECVSGSTLDEINNQAKRAFTYLSSLIW
jgi:sugar phosphate isomerase/epimerase